MTSFENLPRGCSGGMIMLGIDRYLKSVKDSRNVGFKEVDNSDILYCQIMRNIMKNPLFLLLQLMVFKPYGKM